VNSGRRWRVPGKHIEFFANRDGFFAFLLLLDG